MQIEEGLLEKLEADEGSFCDFYARYTEMVMQQARLFPRLSYARLIEARGSWRNDLSRVGEHEPALGNGLDHFKRAGHLAFWLRRTSPIVELVDTITNLADAEGYPLSDDEQAFREVLAAYSNEYIAFDIGYQFCKYYEGATGSKRAETFELTEDYLKTTAHFLKFKTVSPHAMFIIYKSLFHP